LLHHSIQAKSPSAITKTRFVLEQREMDLVMNELSRIVELVKQLDDHLGGNPDMCKLLGSQILSVTENSIASIGRHLHGPRCSAQSAANASIDSPAFHETPW
jgi:hypothetical protein